MKKLLGIAALLTVSVFLMLAVFHLHPVGKPSSTDVDDYYVRNAQEELGANNVVTSIVFDYRGFDTLGEATVLFSAVASVLMVFWGRME